MGPGSIDPYKPFGAEITTKVNFGSKYEFKPDSNPGVGQYDVTTAEDLVKPKKYKAFFAGPKRENKVVNDTPDPGKYDAHLKPFGADIKQNMTLGGKYKF